MKSIFSIILTVFVSFFSFGQAKFSNKDIKEDLNHLKQTLEETHYNVYAYISKEAFENTYKELNNSIDQDSLNLLEATTLFQRLISVINNGHTYIEFPIQSYIEYAHNNGTVFPLELAFENEKALIRKNWSNDTSIKVGSVVKSINGLKMNDVLKAIYPVISAERPYFKNAKIEMYSFPRLYWQVFGKHETFNIEVEYDNMVKTVTLNAIKVIEDYETKRTDVIQPEMNLEFIGNSAYLNPGGFGGVEEKYRTFIDSAFATINAKNSKHLIIDLRNNPGGDDTFSDYLVSYIADKPFQWSSHFTLKTSKSLKEHIRKNNDTTTVFWNRALTEQDGTIYDYTFEDYHPQPIDKRFKGNVYVLVNRQSHSQSAVTAAQIQDYGFGTIVGEETAEYPSLFASVFQFSLPKTQIKVNVSKGYIIRVNGSERQEGVIPDIIIKDHLLDKNDEILEGLTHHIDK